MNRWIHLTCYSGIVISTAILVFCLGFSDLFKDFARDYINQRIEPSTSKGVIVIQQEVLPKLILIPDLHQQLNQEITDYQQAPLLYINRITSGERKIEPAKATILNSKMSSSFADKIHAVKESITRHFQETFQHLLTDVCIFATTNIIGFSCVLLFLAASAHHRGAFLLASMILLSATLYAISVYMNQNWFFNILLDSHMGYWYPLLILLTCLRLGMHFRDDKLQEALQETKVDTLKNIAEIVSKSVL